MKHKTDTVQLSLLIKANFIQKKKQKTLDFLLLSFYMLRYSCETRSLYDTFVELCKHRFVAR